MNYLCAKFDNFSFSRLARFDFIVGQTDRQTESHTHTHTHTDAGDRYTHATTVGVSKNR